MCSLRIRRALRVLFVFFTLVFCLSAVGIIWDGLTDTIDKADVAVVLGNTVDRDGQPSLRLQARLDKALDLYRRGVAPVILVSGGLGAERYDEAAVMRQYLIARGVPAPHILVDSHGDTT